VIQDHLELKRKNAELEGNMPIDQDGFTSFGSSVQW